MNNVAVKVQGLSKVYSLYDNPLDRLKEALSPLRKKYHKEFHALQDISFELPKDQTIGIIGTNGAGKSTLLKIITGVLSASGGSIEVNGRVSSLLELGAGFNPELSGEQNIYFYGAIQGFTKEQMQQKYSSIVEFANIGDFIYQPLKSYSSGMAARLAFAAAVHVEPEILIVDEALSVGDARFQRKCMRKIQEFCEHGTVLLVSHDIETIRKYCDSVLWIDEGQVKEIGAPKEITEAYIKFMYGDSGASSELDAVVESEPQKTESDFGTKEALIKSVSFRTRGISQLVAYSGEEAELKVTIEVVKDVESPILGFEIRNSKGTVVFGDNTAWMAEDLDKLSAGEIVGVAFKFKEWPNLHADNYGITLGLANGTVAAHEQCHYLQEALSIQSIPVRPCGGVFSSLQTEVTVKSKSNVKI